MEGSQNASAPTWYERLGVPPEASTEAIVAAYRASVRLYHPDVSLAPDAEATMVQLNEAFAVLRDPQRREAYDLSLQPPAAAPPPGPSIYPDDAELPRRRTPSYGIDDVWMKGPIPAFARSERRRQTAARDLRAYWRSETEARPLRLVEKVGMMLVLPVFLALMFLLARLLR
jgi:curved DNA-binding protein CbpA